MIGIIAVIGFASLHQELELERVYLLTKNCKPALTESALCCISFRSLWSKDTLVVRWSVQQVIKTPYSSRLCLFALSYTVYSVFTLATEYRTYWTCWVQKSPFQTRENRSMMEIFKLTHDLLVSSRHLLSSRREINTLLPIGLSSFVAQTRRKDKQGDQPSIVFLLLSSR